MKINITLILLLFLSFPVFSQSTIDNLLESVKTNNKQLQASYQNTESTKLSSQTGIFPDNPEVEYIHKFGNSQTGNLQELSITQGFDFPTVYSSQKKNENKGEDLKTMKYPKRLTGK